MTKTWANNVEGSSKELRYQSVIKTLFYYHGEFVAISMRLFSESIWNEVEIFWDGGIILTPVKVDTTMLLEEIGKGVGEAGHKKRKSQAGCSVRGSFSLRPIPPETADIHNISVQTLSQLVGRKGHPGWQTIEQSFGEQAEGKGVLGKCQQCVRCRLGELGLYLSATLSTSGMWGTREKGRAEQVRKKLMGQAIIGSLSKEQKKIIKAFCSLVF